MHIGKDLLPQLVVTARPLGNRFAVITDTVVAPLQGKKVCEALREAGLDAELFVFAAGEASKTRETKQALEDQLLDKRMGRDSCIIAVGGGVVCDLAGFVAATFCRGVPLILVPTTLLAMTDAAIGGKTGVNTPHGKNLIGATYFAKALFCDLSTLETLPERELRSGCAEMIKHGLIVDRKLFNALKEGDPLMQLQRSADIKLRVVAADPYEKGLRRILNFGHTVGHAIEKLENYMILHGEAIAMGMVIESLLSVKLGGLSKEECQEVIEIFRHYEMRHYDADTLYTAMRSDKKAKSAQPRCVLLKRIGEVLPFEGSYCTEISEETFKEAMQEYEELHHCAQRP